jgi:hypothetical protein
MSHSAPSTIFRQGREVRAYRSFSTRYSSVPPFDTYKVDFFDRNLKVFEQARVTLINEFVDRGLGLAAMGKSIDPSLASIAANLIKAGLNTKEIYRWREEAWPSSISSAPSKPTRC